MSHSDPAPESPYTYDGTPSPLQQSTDDADTVREHTPKRRPVQAWVASRSLKTRVALSFLLAVILVVGAALAGAAYARNDTPASTPAAAPENPAHITVAWFGDDVLAQAVKANPTLDDRNVTHRFVDPGKLSVDDAIRTVGDTKAEVIVWAFGTHSPVTADQVQRLVGAVKDRRAVLVGPGANPAQPNLNEISQRYAAAARQHSDTVTYTSWQKQIDIDRTVVVQGGTAFTSPAAARGWASVVNWDVAMAVAKSRQPR